MGSLAASVPTLLGGIGAAKSLRDKPKMPPAIPMPDEELIRKSQRRATSTRKGGRASTILTGTDDGLGG